jgi:hypothetical protein
MLEGLVAALMLSLSHVDLTRADQIELLEATLERLRLLEAVDEEALAQVCFGMN